MALVWSLILGVGLVGVELLARKIGGYRLKAKGLHPDHYTPKSEVKSYNRLFYEQRREYFAGWPHEPELFESDQPTPSYLFKPNRRMAETIERIVPARPGQKAFWSSNSWGFRGPEFSIRKDPDTLRIVCLGASTTEGFNLWEDETFPYFLNVELLRLLAGRKIEVINAGHGAHNIDDHLAILIQRVLPLEPDIVVFYEGHNNIVWSEFLAGAPCKYELCWLNSRPLPYRLLMRGSALFVLLADRLGWNDAQPAIAPHRLDTSHPKPSVVKYRNGVRRLVEETKKAGSTMVVANFVSLPYEGLELKRDERPVIFDDLYKRHSPFTPGEIAQIFDLFNDQAEQAARETGAPFVDLASTFPREVKYFPFDIYHLGREANLIVAQNLGRFLADEVIDTPSLGGNP